MLGLIDAQTSQAVAIYLDYLTNMDEDIIPLSAIHGMQKSRWS